jgi:integrase
MASVFARGRKIYAKIRDAAGVWRQVATGFGVGQEAEAARWARDTQREVDERRDGGGPLTVAVYAERWLAARHTATVADDRTRLRSHVLPYLGDMLLTDVRPRHARDLIMRLRNAGELAPRTIRQVSGILHTMFKSAVIEELIPTNPIVFERGILPKKIDKDPTWRHEAIYTRAEAEQLISDERLPEDRRALYAIKFLAALRHGEAAGLTWALYDAASTPLGAIRLGKTKSAAPRAVPVHPTLARILAEWKLSGWAAIYGRAPRAEDLIVPTRKGRRRAPAASQVQLIEDLERIGLRSRAGVDRNRRGHDLRRTMITLARADGAIDGMLRWVTHGPKPNEMLDVYSSPPWASLCTEVAKLRIEVRAGDVIALPMVAALGASMVQGPEPMNMTGKNKRPQRDSKALSLVSSDTQGQRNRTLAVERSSSSTTERQETAPSVVQSRCDIGFALLRAERKP